MKPFWDLSRFARIHRGDGSQQLRIRGRNVYILPTRYGVLFSVLVLLILIGAINYDNNPIFLLAFALAALGVVGMHATWRNLRGLDLRLPRPRPVFAGDPISLELPLVPDPFAPNGRPAIQLDAPEAEGAIGDLDGGGLRLRVELPGAVRGRRTLPRLTLSSRFPLGLFRAWCYVDSDAPVLVYPRPARYWRPGGAPSWAGSDQGDRGAGTDDFQGLRSYRPTDSPRQIDWKALAGERGLHSKQFGGDRADQLWLVWEDAGPGDAEQRLSRLCRGVLDAEREARFYGLRLPGVEIAPGRGGPHRDRCLKALALFEVPGA